MRALVLASLLVPAVALAQDPPPQAAPAPPQAQSAAAAPAPAAVPPKPTSLPADGPGNGLQLELGVFSIGGVLSGSASEYDTLLLSALSGSTSGTTFLDSAVLQPTPLVSVGYQWDQNAVLVGIDFNSSSASSSVANSGNNVLFGAGPTYRRYLSPLKTGAVTGFAEGGVAILLALPNNSPTSYGFTADLGIGAEWLFVKNIALFAKVLATYTHWNFATSSSEEGESGSSTSDDSAGLGGVIGLTVHL